jgi:hypothetical protein
MHAYLGPLEAAMVNTNETHYVEPLQILMACDLLKKIIKEGCVTVKLSIPSLRHFEQAAGTFS